MSTQLSKELNNFLPAIELGAVQNSNNPEAKKPMQIGIIAIILFFGVFGTWASFAPIKSAVVARGKISYDTKSQTIQHLEGGIIETVFVKEGEKVKEGDLLIKMSNKNSEANGEILSSKLANSLAQSIRLKAEIDSRSSFETNIPETYGNYFNAEHWIPAIEHQQKILEDNLTSFLHRKNILQKRINGLKEELKGVKAQAISNEKQISISENELMSAKSLFMEGNGQKSRVTSLEKQITEMEGKSGVYVASMARIEQKIEETELEILDIESTRKNNLDSALKEIDIEIKDFTEKLRANKDILERSIIQSPHNGIIKGIIKVDSGSVVPPGAKIMEIIPIEDEMGVEAYMAVKDINALLNIKPDLLSSGPECVKEDPNCIPLKAKIRVITYSNRIAPLLNGQITRISADSFQNEKTGFSYYTVYASVPQSELSALSKLKLYPGMQAEVYITTSSRTFLSYLLQPIKLSMDKTFLEQ